MRVSQVELATKLELTSLLAGQVSKISHASDKELLHLQLIVHLLREFSLCPKLAWRVQKSTLASLARELAVRVAPLESLTLLSLLSPRNLRL